MWNTNNTNYQNTAFEDKMPTIRYLIQKVKVEHGLESLFGVNIKFWNTSRWNTKYKIQKKVKGLESRYGVMCIHEIQPAGTTYAARPWPWMQVGEDLLLSSLGMQRCVSNNISHHTYLASCTLHIKPLVQPLTHIKPIMPQDFGPGCRLGGSFAYLSETTTIP